KENVIMGHLIPAGTGLDRYSQMRLVDEEGNEIEPPAIEPEPFFDAESVNGDAEAVNAEAKAASAEAKAASAEAKAASAEAKAASADGESASADAEAKTSETVQNVAEAETPPVETV
ncbi:MAG: hypothetical protein OXO51_18310, partial [Gemmatimonadota bacterium]|nr:hypothetical protein [Gemmatimonadota bacterium]